jgi:hypothetical protein
MAVNQRSPTVNQDEYSDEIKTRVELLYSFAVGDDADMHGLPRKEAAGIAIDMLVQTVGALCVPLDLTGRVLVVDYLIETMERASAKYLAKETIREAARHD